MGGIFACVGDDAYQKVLSGLKMLQYRGYDSCGIAYYENEFKTLKAVGALDKLTLLNANVNIAFGHTRWATNGVVNLVNAHPHNSFDDKLTIVHNGIISNANIIKSELQNLGIKFKSSTDTEVIVNYLAYLNKTYDLEYCIKSLFKKLDGSFALIIGTFNGELYLVKKFSPLNILKTNNEGE